MFVSWLFTVALALRVSSMVLPRQEAGASAAGDGQVISAEVAPACESRCQNGLNILTTCSQTSDPTETADLDCICAPANQPAINDCFQCIAETGDSSETVNVLAAITPICQARSVQPPA